MRLRINFGEFARRKLSFAVSKKTRAALARLRYEVIDFVKDFLPHAYVLDLFAGTGIFGIEALSLGAKKVYFVDKSRINLEAILKNLSKLKVAKERFELVNEDVIKALTRFKRQGLFFDLVFIDPPYDTLLKVDIKRQSEYVAELLARSRDVLNPKSVIVLKLHKKIGFWLPEGLGILEEKRFGINRVYFIVQVEYVQEEFKDQIKRKTRWQRLGHLP